MWYGWGDEDVGTCTVLCGVVYSELWRCGITCLFVSQLASWAVGRSRDVTRDVIIITEEDGY